MYLQCKLGIKNGNIISEQKTSHLQQRMGLDWLLWYCPL